MFNLLKLAAEVLLKPYKITDKASCQAFLKTLISQIRSHAAATGTKIDHSLLKQIEFVVNNKLLFNYVYRLIFDQLQTAELLFESADEKTITELVKNTVPNDSKSPEAINPIVIIALVTRIISMINTMKNK